MCNVHTTGTLNGDLFKPSVPVWYNNTKKQNYNIVYYLCTAKKSIIPISSWVLIGIMYRILLYQMICKPIVFVNKERS